MSFLIVFIIETVFYFHHNFVLKTNLNFLLWYFIKMSFSSRTLLRCLLVVNNVSLQKFKW